MTVNKLIESLKMLVDQGRGDDPVVIWGYDHDEEDGGWEEVTCMTYGKGLKRVELYTDIP